MYLDWFEKYIKEWTAITTVDATEGGALIHGSKIMTLKKAIQKYCKRDFNVKWHINRVKKLFPDEYQEIPLEYFENADKKLEDVRKKADQTNGDHGKAEKHLPFDQPVFCRPDLSDSDDCDRNEIQECHADEQIIKETVSQNKMTVGIRVDILDRGIKKECRSQVKTSVVISR